ncbi:heavy metal translocating P-type ATPase [Desulfosporosinus shakirovi]|uniref:heavy metal translocating P-type ATPase n=1 Tax=Desulfosporosinus shakirovi TaxID=2885154 RepID=UPI001E4CFC91|nr:heavy metal translocating P-type ATPase [Desulfosporosinus sp. SRJS8]MCB8815014.1 heavy metal translocating P-type ATPase [Desulfosporosinus sp. SRJS8]
MPIHKELPLLKCEIIHSISGRVRIKCRTLKYLQKQALDLEKNLNNIAIIQEATVNTITGNVLVYFDSQLADGEEILETVETVIYTYSLIAHKNERSEKNNVPVKERRLQEESYQDILARIAVTGAVFFVANFSKGFELIPQKGLLSRFTTIPALLGLGLSKSIFESGIKSLLVVKRPNADTLTMASIITSLVSGSGVSALTTILLSDIAELITAYTMNRTRNAIKDMIEVGETAVWKKLEDDTVVQISLSEIQVEDLVLGQTGNKISIDGIIVEGEAVIDQAAITGEFMPVVRKKGERVFAGTVIQSGNVTVKAEKVGDDTAVSRIVSMVEDASNNKAQIQVYADRFSAQLIPLNFALAGIVYLTTKSVVRASNMLIIDYSCGVRLSTATALSAAIHTAAKNGILLKGGNLIEAMAEADTLILDKTGTITEGKPKITSIVTKKNATEEEVIKLAAAAEETSNHPLAFAIISKMRRSGWTIPEHTETIVHVARGVETKVENQTVRVGNRKFMEENGIEISELDKEITHLIDRGENVIFVSLEEVLVGVLGVQDTLRENMKKAINRLRYLGFDELKLLTGDLAIAAEVVAHSMAMDGFESELLPEDKAKYVLQAQSKGSRVIMVGDGINDAPALAYADVGVAIGNTRTDIAIEAADVTIAGDDPLLIPGMVNMSRKTMTIVKQNFAATIGINTVGLMLGATGILPVFWGSVLHNSTTILVVCNSARLLFHNFERNVS